MDIKEIAQKLAPGYWKRDQWNIEYFDSVGFAEALIESYKVELLKEVGEPVARYLPENKQHQVVTKSLAVSLGKDKPVIHDGWIGLFTSNQVAAAVLKATGPLEERIRRRMDDILLQAERQVALEEKFREVSTQLAAAQEENGRLENQVLARDAELWGRTQEILGLKDQLAKAEQLWQVAQGRCDGLEEKLAKAEQRVAEWQPISTAPKDGTWFFGWRQYATRPRIIKFDSDYGEFIDEDGIHVYEVINWLPLPKAPNTESS